MTTTTKPAMRAFTVIKREGQDDFWLAIGAAFPHQDGDGYNVILQALPIPSGDGQCKIVLRPPKDDKADTPSQESDTNVSRLREDRNNKSGSRRR